MCFVRCLFWCWFGLIGMGRWGRRRSGELHYSLHWGLGALDFAGGFGDYAGSAAVGEAGVVGAVAADGGVVGFLLCFAASADLCDFVFGV